MFTGAFYFTIGNIHPKYRSSLKSIQLLAIAKTKLIKEYGIDRILNVIVDDVIKLEEVCSGANPLSIWY